MIIKDLIPVSSIYIYIFFEWRSASTHNPLTTIIKKPWFNNIFWKFCSKINSYVGLHPYSLATLVAAQLLDQRKNSEAAKETSMIYYISHIRGTVLEWGPTVHGQQEAGQGSSIHCTVEEKAVGNRGLDIQRTPWWSGRLLKRLPTVLWVSNLCKGHCFLLVIKHVGVILALSLIVIVS